MRQRLMIFCRENRDAHFAERRLNIATGIEGIEGRGRVPPESGVLAITIRRLIQSLRAVFSADGKAEFAAGEIR